MRLKIKLGLILMIFTNSLFADALNKPQGMSSASQAKVLRAMANSFANNEQDKMHAQKGATCSPQVGVTNISGNAQAPREVTTVIRGDVISVCK